MMTRYLWELHSCFFPLILNILFSLFSLYQHQRAVLATYWHPPTFVSQIWRSWRTIGRNGPTQGRSTRQKLIFVIYQNKRGKAFCLTLSESCLHGKALTDAFTHTLDKDRQSPGRCCTCRASAGESITPLPANNQHCSYTLPPIKNLSGFLGDRHLPSFCTTTSMQHFESVSGINSDVFLP